MTLFSPSQVVKSCFLPKEAAPEFGRTAICPRKDEKEIVIVVCFSFVFRLQRYKKIRYMQIILSKTWI